MRDARPPHLPLGELEAIVGDVAEVLGRIDGAVGVNELGMRLVQCQVAIAACRRYHFSTPLLRALSAKVLEVEADALVLHRTARAHALSKPGRSKEQRKARGRGRPQPKRGKRDERRPRGPSH